MGDTPLAWNETDCFWCGTVFDPDNGACPHCASTIQTGSIPVIGDQDGLLF